MTEQAIDLLQKMALAYDGGHENDFDIEFYMSTSEATLVELENLSFIVRKNNIIGSIMLTKAGYAAAKK